MRNSILVVEDNPKNLQLISSVLDPYYQLLLANNGEKAIRTAEAKLPDIILLDIMMPGENGYEVCKKLKSNDKTKEIPVIFLTVKDDEDEIALGYELGGVDYITKPFKTKEVLARIKTQLELKNAHDKLQIQNEELKELLANRDKFFSIIAHDLKSPFNGFLGLTEMMATKTSEFSNEEIAKYAKMLNNSGTNLYNLLENLLEWAKIQRGIFEYSPEKINVDSLIQECIDSIATIADQKEITIFFTPTQSVSVLADKNMFNTVLRNLIINAIKFSYPGSRIDIMVKEIQNDMIELAVSDKGIGMSEDEINKLFSINAKVSRIGTTNEPSTGLGLLLCKEFVEKLGGSIWVESTIEKGSTFFFSLPRHK